MDTSGQRSRISPALSRVLMKTSDSVMIFSRHIVRCKLLLFVLDTAGSEGRNPIEDLRTLRRELDLYDPTLSQRPWMIAANKMDLPGAEENLVTIRNRFSDKVIMPMAAAHGVGIEEFKRALQNLLGL